MLWARGAKLRVTITTFKPLSLTNSSVGSRTAAAGNVGTALLLCSTWLAVSRSRTDAVICNWKGFYILWPELSWSCEISWPSGQKGCRYEGKIRAAAIKGLFSKCHVIKRLFGEYPVTRVYTALPSLYIRWRTVAVWRFITFFSSNIVETTILVNQKRKIFKYSFCIKLQTI